MSQIVTAEEIAALFEELREVEGGPAAPPRVAPGEIMSRGRVSPEPNHRTTGQNLSNWLMALADLRWPNL
jgi:hypothetical protein